MNWNELRSLASDFDNSTFDDTVITQLEQRLLVAAIQAMYNASARSPP